jgi:signal transduction histidine kinase/ActR/RegA family two-component response regulator
MIHPSDPLAFRRLVWRAVVAPLVLLASLAGVLTWQVTNLLLVTHSVERSDRIIARTNELEKLLVNMETGLRGFVITHEKVFLQPYEASEQLIKPAIERLVGLVEDNPSELQHIERVQQTFDGWHSYARRLMALDHATGEDKALVLTEEGKRLMDAMRVDLTAIGQSEISLRDDRSARAQAAARITLYTAIGMTLGVGGLLAYLAWRQLRLVSENYSKALSERDRLLASERSARSEAERVNRMKDEFLATLSHELRTPLTAILGWSQLMRSGTLTSEETGKGIQTIERNALVQTQLIDQLLDMSKIISGKIVLNLAVVDLPSVIQTAIESIRPAIEAKQIRLEQKIERLPSDQHIVGDLARLQQVIWNLLSNAVKFTPKDGQLRISLTNAHSHALLTVTDSGIGIAPAFLPFIFERFRQADASTTRKYGGMGLGLAIVKQLVELHGGTVGVSSPGEGQGASFRVVLPFATSTVIPAAPQEAPAAPLLDLLADSVEQEAIDLEGLKILVVDDEADARELVRRILVGCHAEVFTAASVAEAYETFQRELPGVIVSDIGMPEHDGFELIRKVRTQGPPAAREVPAVALSAFARPDDRRRILEAGFQVHLPKPVIAAELIAVVATIAGRA